MFRRWIARRKSSRTTSGRATGHPEILTTLERVAGRNAAIDDIAICDLATYRRCVKELPRPSDEQIRNFVEYVCVAHSWYKHLPLAPPGVSFRFFLDPCAGFSRVIQVGGGVVPRERTTDSLGSGAFTTEKYRDQFGYLACDRAGNRFVDMNVGPFGEYGECDVFCADEKAYRIPAEVAHVGTAEATAIIHPLTATVWVWERRLDKGRVLSWPAETGGPETVVRIAALCRRWRASQGRAMVGIDEELDSLLSPERERLQHDMSEAVNRMLALTYDERR